MDPAELPEEQLTDWIRDCLALSYSADARGDEHFYQEVVERLGVLVKEYQRRFPGPAPVAGDLLH